MQCWLLAQQLPWSEHEGATSILPWQGFPRRLHGPFTRSFHLTFRINVIFFFRLSKIFLCGLRLLAPALSPYTRISPPQPHKGPCDVPFGSTAITRCDKGFFCPPASIKGLGFAQQLGLVTLHIAQRLCLEHVFTMPRSVALPSRKRSVTACRVSPALGVSHSSAPRTG